MLTGASEFFDERQQTDNELALQILRDVSESLGWDIRLMPAGTSKLADEPTETVN